jgi:hypothetical protein
MTLLLSLSLAGILATVIATVVILAPHPVQNCSRRIFLIGLNLNPWTMGTWRKSFTTRETFLATWFVVFVASLVVGAFVARLRHANVTP